MRKSKFTLTRLYNEQAHNEIKVMDSPRIINDQRPLLRDWFYYDSDEVWGVPNEELKAQIERYRRRWLFSLNPRTRSNARKLYYLWCCREAATKGLSVTWR